MFSVDELLSANETSCTATSCFVRVQCASQASTGVDNASLCSDVHHFFAPFKSLELGKGSVEVVDVKASSTAPAFDVTIRSGSFVALFVEVETASVSQGFWSESAFLMLPNETKVLTFTVFEEDDAGGAAQLSAEAFQSSLHVRWLQKIYETSAATALVV